MNAATIVLWIARIVVVAMLSIAGYLKMTGHQAEVDLFAKLGMEPVGRYVIGGLEIFAAVLVLIPTSQVFGAFLGLGIMVGAMIAHLTAIGLGGLQFASLGALGCLVILYLRRQDAWFLRQLFDR